MSSALTVFGANAFLNMLLGGSKPVPKVYYLALLTAPPGEATTGALLPEPGAGIGYGRKAVPNDATTWGQAANGFLTTTANIQFNTATADWPVITHYALCEGSFEGGVYLYGSFAVPRKVRLGDRVTIPAGILSITATSTTIPVATSF